MTNEDFQRIILEELKDLKVGQKGLESRMITMEEGQRSLEEGQKSLESRMITMEEGQRNLESRMTNMEIGQRQIIEKLDAVWEQTAILTEFRTETNQKLDTIIEENNAIKEIIGVHEVDLRRIKKII